MANATLVNFAAGETSPKSRGRFDIESYNSSCRKLENFIAEVQGSARYRPGFRHVAQIRYVGSGGTLVASHCRIIPFQSATGESYMLEFTPGKMRVFQNEEALTVARTTITGIVDDSGYARFNVASMTGLDTGDQVIFSGIVGPTELNGRVFHLASYGTYFRVFDPITGTHLKMEDLSAAYVSGGSVSEVISVATPYYTEDDLASISYAQTPSEMYLASYRHPPQKLTFVSATKTWTLGTYSRINDPLTAGAAINISTAYTTDGVTYVELASAAIDEHVYTIAGVVGMPDLNAVWRLREVSNPGGAPKYAIQYYGSGHVGYEGRDAVVGGTYVSGGTATPAIDFPIAVAFFEGRSVFAGTNVRPGTLFISRSPNPTTGASRYDDFTGGTDADHACFFTLAPVNGQVTYCLWAVGTARYLLVGTFGGVFRVSGGGLDEPLTPTSINSRQIDSYGCRDYPPAVNGATAYFTQRGGVAVRSIEYSVDADDLRSSDMCLNAEQIAYSPLTRLVFSSGRFDVVWALREDGVLCGVTVSGAENVTGWHRHTMGGTAAKVVDLAVLPRPGLSDQIWVVVERTIAGLSPTTQRSLEVFSSDVAFPDIEDYYGSTATEALDAAAYRAAVVAAVNTAVHLDSYKTYNSTPATVISGLYHLEGETVTAVADGVEVSGLTVTNGSITLPSAASVVHVGLPYTGLLQTQNLELGGRSGPAQAKPRNISALNIRFLNSKGGKYGTDLYHLYDIDTEDPDAWKLADGSAAPLFNGVRKLAHFDNWSTENDRNEKTVFVVQDAPFPCVVQFIDIEYDTGDE